MRKRLAVIFLVIVLAPLALLLWFGWMAARRETVVVKYNLQTLLEGELSQYAHGAAELPPRWRDAVRGAAPSPATPAGLRDLSRQSGLVRQYFMLDSNGNLVYPSPSELLTASEIDFLRRTETFWTSGAIQARASAPAVQSQQMTKGPAPMREANPAEGWHVLYQGGGANLIYWWRLPGEGIVGCEYNTARLLADLIGAFPETDPAATAPGRGRIALVDAEGGAIYQWGTYEPGTGEAPQASLPLEPPLSAWRLVYYVPRELVEVPRTGLLFNMFSSAVVVALALGGLALYFYRENAREMREAAQRVTFVNQVSHELKTPLTNIRMYAEMLEDDLDNEDDQTRRRLGVIVSESQRLSRLIGNVLTFSRAGRNAVKLRPATSDLNAALRHTAGNYEAALKAKGLEVRLNLAAGGHAAFDNDALDQIVGNLLSNVEKYAVGGSHVTISCRREGDMVRIVVEDDGPGVPPRERSRIFDPFYRVSNRLTDGVAGAGIGLAIARDLAHRHGGDLVLESAARGARFVLTLRAPVEQQGNTI